MTANTVEYDDRCWHELEDDELAAEAQEIANRAADPELSRLVASLRDDPSHVARELVIDRIETAHAVPLEGPA